MPVSGEVARWTGFRHGNAGLYTKSVAKEVAEKQIKELAHLGDKPVPGWPGIDKVTHQLEIPNELLWIAFDHRMFVTDWRGIAALYEAKRALLGMFPWIDYVIKGDGGLETVPQH